MFKPRDVVFESADWLATQVEEILRLERRYQALSPQARTLWRSYAKATLTWRGVPEEFHIEPVIHIAILQLLAIFSELQTAVGVWETGTNLASRGGAWQALPHVKPIP